MSVRKDKLSWLLVLAVVAGVIATAYVIILPHLRPSLTLRVGDGVYDAVIAQNAQEMKKDLAASHRLHDNKAALFVYDSDDVWGISTEASTDPIDIVWLDGDKEVIYIVKNASSEAATTTFAPEHEARYVILLPAGSVDGKRIVTGKSAEFDLMEAVEAS